MASLPTSAEIDRASGARLGTLWVLPAFGVVLPGVASTVGIDPVSRAAWLASGVICWAAFAYAAVQRAKARALIRALSSGAELLDAGGVAHDGETYDSDTRLVQHEMRIGLLVLELALLTAPRKHGSGLVANVVTALLGWWSLPWGPVHTIRTLVSNARGGTTRTVAELLHQLRTMRERPPSPWWRSALALDSGDRLKVMGNVAVAIFLLLFLGLIGFAVVAAHIHGPGG